MADVLLSSYNPAGIQDTIYEDVEGVIQNITPYKTPFIASIGKTVVDNILHEWTEDEIKAPTGTNKAVEGADPEATLRKVPARLNNYAEIMEDTFKVTTTQDKVNTIGRAKSSSYQLSKSLKYLNTELEFQSLNNATKAGGDATTERSMMGLQGFLTTNVENFGGAKANTNLFTESLLMDMSQSIFDHCDEENHILLVDSAQARQIAAWSANSRITVNTDASKKELIMVVLVLETPFGRIRVVIDRYIDVATDTGNLYSTAFLYEPGKMSIGWLRNWKTEKLAKTGDSQKYMTVGEMTMVVHSEKAAAKCDNLFDSAV